MLERQAVYDFHDERVEAVGLRGGAFGDLLHQRPVIALQSAPQCVRQHLLGDALGEGLRIAMQQK